MFENKWFLFLALFFALILILILGSSMSRTLTPTPESNSFWETSPEGGNNFNDLWGEADFSIGAGIEESGSDLPNSLTPEEEIAMGEKLTHFMSLDDVENLTDEELMRLNEELNKLTLDEIKRMSIGEFIAMIRRIKNE